MHEGHRKRMYEKVKTDSAILDHEILETILFNAYPRKNTNPVAHSLINAFGSLAGVFEADVEQLMTVDGVGENVALYIKIIGECNKRIRTRSSGVAVLKTYEEFRRFVAVRLRGIPYEVIEIYCLEKSGKVKRISTYTSEESSKVEVECAKIAAIIAKEHPYGILVAHNHLSGSSAPSENDNRFTAEIQLMCSMNNIILHDHCIYASDDNIYSYFKSGKIDELRREFTFKGVVDKQMKSADEEKKFD